MIKDYGQIQLKQKEKIRYFTEGIFVVMTMGYLFYESIIVVICLIPLSFWYVKKKKESLVKKRKWELNLQFKEVLMGISAALNAGYSMENSFCEARKDMLLLYDENTDMIQELDYITRQIQRNHVVEELLKDLARRSQVEDIMDFAEVFSIAKRSGGNLVKIIHETCKKMNDKIEVKREIRTLIAGKTMESRIMMLVPLGIIGYMKVFSPEFMAGLYHNIIGICVMTICLFVYMGSIFLAERIITIEV